MGNNVLASLAWYLAGTILGLTIAQWLVKDDGISAIISIISVAILSVELGLLIYVLWRWRHDN